MHSDVPQGSVIGPLLFFLFVNDLPDVLETLTLLFADDVKMVTRVHRPCAFTVFLLLHGIGPLGFFFP